MEALWAPPQTELPNTKKLATTFELAAAMADHINNSYNTEGNNNPDAFEAPWTTTQPTPQLS